MLSRLLIGGGGGGGVVESREKHGCSHLEAFRFIFFREEDNHFYACLSIQQCQSKTSFGAILEHINMGFPGSWGYRCMWYPRSRDVNPWKYLICPLGAVVPRDHRSQVHVQCRPGVWWRPIILLFCLHFWRPDFSVISVWRSRRVCAECLVP